MGSVIGPKFVFVRFFSTAQGLGFEFITKTGPNMKGFWVQYPGYSIIKQKLSEGDMPRASYTEKFYYKTLVFLRKKIAREFYNKTFEFDILRNRVKMFYNKILELFFRRKSSVL